MIVGMNEALAHAQIVGAHLMVEEARKHEGDATPWRHDFVRARWSGRTGWQRMALPLFADRISDGSGWNAVDVMVAVIPTRPMEPINADLVQTIGLDFELVSWFDNLQKASPKTRG